MPNQGYLAIGAVQPGTTSGTNLGQLSIGALQSSPPSTASLTATLATLTVSATATSTAPANATGGLTVTLGSLTVSATATAGPPTTATGTLSATLGTLTATATASSTAPLSSTATLTATLASLALTATATATQPPPSTGTLAATLGTLTAITAAIGNHISFEQSLKAELATIADLTTLTGNRLYESLLPQKSTLPALVYQTGTELGPIWLTGQGTIRNETVTLDLISLSKSTTRAMMDAIEQHFVLADFRGQLGSGVYVAETILQSVDTSYVRLADGTDRAVRLATITLTMRYAQP